MVEDNNEVLKKEFLKFAPGLEEDYKKFVRSTFASMQKDLGPSLIGTVSQYGPRSLGCRSLRMESCLIWLFGKKKQRLKLSRVGAIP